MATEQLALFETRQTGITFVQVCHLCGQPVCAVPIGDASDPWHAAALWCYVGQKNHERECHA